MSLPPTDEERFSADEWARYLKELLLSLLPYEQALIRRTRIMVTPEKGPNATANSFFKTIRITKGLILLLESKEECAVLLAHELGHIKKKHAAAVRAAHSAMPNVRGLFLFLAWHLGGIFGRRPRSQTFDDYLYAIEKRQEIEADEFMARTLPPEMNAARVCVGLFLKLARIQGTFDDLSDPWAKVHLARIERLLEIAQESK